MDWLKVARVETTHLFIVKTEDGAHYTGTIATPLSRISKIEVVEEPDRKTLVEQSKIVGLEETSQSFFKRFSGEVTVGATFSKGNNATQYNLRGNAEYPGARWGVQADISSNLSASSAAQTATRNQATVTAYRMLPWRNFYYGGLGDLLQSSVQGISLQSTLGGGIGRYLKNSSRTRISILGGLAWLSAKYKHADVAIATQQVAAGPVAADIKLFVFKKTNLTSLSYLVPAINDSGRIHFSTIASYYWEDLRTLLMEPVVIRKLGYTATGAIARQRLRVQHGVEVDLWLPLIGRNHGPDVVSPGRWPLGPGHSKPVAATGSDPERD